MNELNRIVNLNSDGSATIYLYGEIGGDGPDGVNGFMVAQEIQFLSENGVEVINIRINSPGGLVSDGLSIFNAIMNSDAEVNTYVDGIAASIAGIIAMAGNKRYMNDFSRIMVHMPSIPSANTIDNMNPAVRESIKQISEVIGKILTNNTRMNRDAIMGMMEKETWIEPEIALSMGFVDEIIDTDRKEIKFVENTVKQIYNSCMEDLQDTLCLINTDLSMKEVKNFLQLEEAANEEQILNTVKNISEELDSAKNELEDVTNTISDKDSEIAKLNEELSALKEEIASFKQAEIVEFVENNIDAGKLDAEKKESLIEKATNDFDGFKDIVNSISIVSAKAADVTEKIENKVPEITNLRELEQKDPARYKDLYNNNKEEYARLYELTYGTKLKK